MEIQEKDFQRLVKFVKIKYGIDLAEKKFLVQTRLTNYILDCGFYDFTDYFNTVYNDPNGKEIANMINRLTTNHTYFMRELEHFNHFTEVFLPKVTKTCSNNQISIWSAGCSFGNEPYNLAMCADDYFDRDKNLWDYRILATDVSLYALRTAKNGVFPPQDLECLPKGWEDKYFFQKHNKLYQVKDSVRRNVIFRYHNLIDEISFKSKFDLILCRNVMIYFDEKTKSDLCQRFYDATKEGGYLYIGHAEAAPINMPYKKVAPAIYQKISHERGNKNE